MHRLNDFARPLGLTATLLLTAALTASLTAQQLATFDPASGKEFAAAACPPAPPNGWSADLVSPTGTTTAWTGAITVDNVRQLLYYATGKPTDGIQRTPVSAIGTGATPTTFPLPGGFGQLTGMEIDPTVATGAVLILTDGAKLVRFDTVTKKVLGSPFNGPKPVGKGLTGLAYNPFNKRLYVIDDTSHAWSRPLSGGAWVGPIKPGVNVPKHATGISFCKTKSGPPFAAYWDGTVLNLQTGAKVTLPGNGTGVRHHRGLTFLGKAINLRGGGDPVWRPEVEVRNGLLSGSDKTVVEVRSRTNPVFLAVDLLPKFNGGTSIPGFGGLMMINPATSLIVGLPGGTTRIPTSLVGVPPGVGLTFQAANKSSSRIELSEALHGRTHR